MESVTGFGYEFGGWGKNWFGWGMGREMVSCGWLEASGRVVGRLRCEEVIGEMGVVFGGRGVARAEASADKSRRLQGKCTGYALCVSGRVTRCVFPFWHKGKKRGSDAKFVVTSSKSMSK